MACNRMNDAPLNQRWIAWKGPVGPVVAVCRHAVLAASFIKMGSDAVYAVHGAVPKGKVGG